VIKIYADGLLTGKYLNSLNIGDYVDFRGPKGAMRYRRGWATRLGMISGGTGITPMFQLIRAICEDQLDTTEVSLVYANRSEEDILLRAELDRFARLYPKKLRIWYVLDHPPSDWPFGTGFVNKEMIQGRLPAASTDTKIVLCGPPGMVNASKKNLVELGFEAPGSVSRMSDQIFCF
jgi:cytochrome-b5 reductase